MATKPSEGIRARPPGPGYSGPEVAERPKEQEPLPGLMDRFVRPGARRVWWVIAGSALCMNFWTSIIVVGWLFRWMQSRALLGWWKQSDRSERESFASFCGSFGPDGPDAHPRWLLAEKRNFPDAPHGSFARAFQMIKVPFHSLWLNLKTGLVAILCIQVVLGWGSLLMHFGWEHGWLNSFNKGYEQAWIGPTLGIVGMLLFIAGLFYVPMARAHMATTGDYRAFFDIGFVWRLVRANLTGYLGLAAVIALVSLPLTVLYHLPVGFDGQLSSWTNASDTELRQMLENYFLACAPVVFLAMLLTYGLSARVYRGGLQRAMLRGTITREELPQRLRTWLHRLDQIPVVEPMSGGVVTRAVVGSARWAYRRLLWTALFVVWLLFSVRIFAGEFLHRHQVSGFLNHPLVQLPSITHIPSGLGNGNSQPPFPE